jgi:DNA polymerase (family 10)
MKLGVATARRGWLEKKDIINTLPLSKLIKKVSNPS